MRVALFEMHHRDDIPVEVAIDEAVNLREGVLRRRRAGLRQRHPRLGGARAGRGRAVRSHEATRAGEMRAAIGRAAARARRAAARSRARRRAGGRARPRGGGLVVAGRATRSTGRCARAADGLAGSGGLPRRPARAGRGLPGRTALLRAAEATAGLDEAMRYSLLAGGKRIRPVLCLATARAVGRRSRLGAAGGRGDRADPHLLADPRRPAGDGRRRAAPRAPDLARRLRRGRRDPRRRRAVRRGDPALLRRARTGDPARVLAALGELVAATGVEGMVGGQYVDVTADRASSTPRRCASCTG